MREIRNITEELVKTQPRDKFSSKGDFGAALLVCGSEGMMGAALLAVGGALRSGCGLVTAVVPEKYAALIYSAHPSAMVSTTIPEDLSRFTAIGCGSGLGLSTQSVYTVGRVLTLGKPLVLDADALNLISMNRDVLKHIPANSILTPHLGELRRLIGPWNSEAEKIDRVTEMAQNLSIYIVVKGAQTTIFTPRAERYVNPTGNPGMAKGGSGDVLTGLMTGILARTKTPLEAAAAAVYHHGAAGDRAAEVYGEESMNSHDIIDRIRIF